MSDLQLNVLPARALSRAIARVTAAGRVPFIWGSPGIGKSAVTTGAFAATGRNIIDIRLSQWDAVDSRGIPQVVNGRTRWALPELFPTDPDADDVIVMDEFNSATKSVMAAMYQLVLDRGLGDYVLPKKVSMVALGNNASDRGIVNAMGTALEGRFIHLGLAVDHDEWTEWAIDADIDINVVVYLRNISPDSLHKWRSDSPTKGQPTPRTWEFVSNIIKGDDLSDRQVTQALIAGSIGDGEAAAFLGYLDIAAQMPDPEECINNPTGSPVPTDPTVTFALCAAIAHRTNKGNVDGAHRYASRLSAEFEALLVSDSARRSPDLKSTAAYIKWSIKNGREHAK